jgi:2-oxoglutaroyl-CoA hydrolase
MTERRQLDNLRVEVDSEGRVGRLYIERVEKLNAITMQMRRDIGRCFEWFTEDDRVRVVVVRGAGDTAFSAGGDIPEFLRTPAPDMANLAYHLGAPERCPKPVIAAIDGHCYGGGLEFALACDFRIATPRSRFAFPEITLGAMPGSGGTQRAVRLMGLTRAKAMVLTGLPIDAEAAERYGLITRVVPVETFELEVQRLTQRLVKLSPVALRFAKMVLNRALDASLAAGLEMEGKAMAILTSTEDFAEGVQAWETKREPDFKGR